MKIQVKRMHKRRCTRIAYSAVWSSRLPDGRSKSFDCVGKRVPMQHKRPGQEEYFEEVVWEQCCRRRRREARFHACWWIQVYLRGICASIWLYQASVQEIAEHSISSYQGWRAGPWSSSWFKHSVRPFYQSFRGCNSRSKCGHLELQWKTDWKDGLTSASHVTSFSLLEVQLRAAINEHLLNDGVSELRLSEKPVGAINWQPIQTEDVQQVQLTGDLMENDAEWGLVIEM